MSQRGSTRESAHDFEGGSRVVLADRDVAGETGFDRRGVPSTSVMSSRSSSRCCVRLLFGDQRPHGLVVHPLGRDRDQLLLRVAERGQLAAEDAAGVEADGVVQPLGIGDRRMAVHHHRLAPVVGRPVVANRKAELVGLAGGLAEERKAPDATRGATLQLFVHTRVGDDEVAVVEHEVADRDRRRRRPPRG